MHPDDTPTNPVQADDNVVPDISPDDALKASLLAGGGGRIGRFHVLRLLGEGGMGMVFVGYDEELGRKVAIKLLRQPASEDAVSRARLTREAQALARLSHPNVVTVYEVGEFGSQIFIAMEFVTGPTLQAWLQAEPRPWRDVVRVFVEAGRGLAVAHAAGILHRDFKPANVLLGEDGRVRVVDFGLALPQVPAGEQPDALETHVRLPGADRATDSRSSAGLTQAGSIMGTPAYMAPERFTFDRPIDPRSDQFSFCVALFEGLYGARPFPGRRYEDVRAAIVIGQVVDPPGPPRKVPGWLRKRVLRGLAREPGERFPDMNALLAAIQSDPQRTRDRALVGLATAGILVGGGYALAHATVADAAAVCPDARPKLRPIWDDRRVDVERALLATDASYAADTWARVAARLGEHADAWAAGHRDACEAHARGEQSALLLDLRMACLERRRGELGAFVARLLEADRDTVRAAAAAADALPTPALCADAAALTAAVPVPEDPAVAVRVAALRDRLAEARAALATSKHDAAETIAAEVVAAAGPLAFRPLLAEALTMRGRVEAVRAAYEPARASFEEALWLADIVGDDLLLAEAMADLVAIVGDRLARPDDALRWRRHADAVVARSGADTIQHAALLRSFGATASTRGRLDEARVLLRQALAIDERHAGTHPAKIIKDLLMLGNIEFSAGDLLAARPIFERALALGEQLHGPDHPEVARLVGSLASVVMSEGDLAAAEPLFTRSLMISAAALGDDHPERAATLVNFAGLHATRKDFERARPLFEEALAIEEKALGKDHPDLAPALHNLAILAVERGDFPAARAHVERAVKIRERSFPADSPFIAESIAERGYIAWRERDLPAAIRELERAIAGLAADAAHTHRMSLPQARFNLAKALRAAGKRERADVEARQAAADYRTIGQAQYAAHIAEIDAWLGDPRLEIP